MATKSLGTLTIDMILKHAGFERGMTRSQRQMTEFQKKARELRRSMNELGATLATTFAGAATSVTALVGYAGEAAREIRTLAQVSNTSAKEFQQSAYAAERFGIEQEKLADIFKDVNDRIGDFLQTGGGPMLDFFEQIAPKVGLSIRDFARLSGPEALQKYVKALEDANVSQADMTFFLEAIASDATKLLPLLRDNGAEMAVLADEAGKVGAVLEDFQLDALIDAKDSIDRLSSSMKAISNTALASMAPAIEAIARGLQEDLADGLDNSQSRLLDWAKVWGDVLAFAADASTAAFGTIGTLFESAGDTVGAVFAKMFADLSGDAEAGQRVLEDWHNNQSEIWTNLLENSNFTRYRDALKDVREEQERISGISEIRINASLRTDSIGSSGDDEKEKKAEERARAAAAKAAEIAEEARMRELEGVKNFLKSREDLELEAYARRAEIILNNMEVGTERDQLLLDNARKHAESLIEIELYKQAEINQAVLDGVHTREQFEQASGKNQVKSVLGTLQSITAGVATHDKRLFALNKAASIGNAIVNTAEGVTKALSAYPPPLSFAMAAAQAAAGLAQISAIRSASFGGGSTPSVVGSTPTLNGQPVQTTPGPTILGSQQQEQGQRVELHVYGDILTEDRLVRTLQGYLEKDGVLIHGNTRQAEALRGG